MAYWGFDREPSVPLRWPIYATLEKEPNDAWQPVELAVVRRSVGWEEGVDQSWQTLLLGIGCP
jgi:hypothetical protein